MRTLILAFMIVAGALSAADFRAVNWGDSPKQILKAEEIKPTATSEDEIVFSPKIEALTVNVVYRLTDEKCTSGRYLFTHQYRETDRYISDYDALQKLLVQKYGAPTTSQIRCTDDFYRDFPARWGMALVTNKLSLESQWDTAKLHIRHAIYTQADGKVAHLVDYSPQKTPTENSFISIYDEL
jgi:hypothetical protein